MGVDVILDRRHRTRRHLGEPVAERLVPDDQRLEVRQPAERLGRVTGPLQAQQRVSRRHLPGRAGVPVRAGADRHGIGLPAIGDRRQRSGQVRLDYGRLARRRRVGIQQPQPGPLAQRTDRVVRDVVIHEVNVALAQHVQRAALFRRPGTRVHPLKTKSLRTRARRRPSGRRAAAAATGRGHEREDGKAYGCRIAPRAYAHRHTPPRGYLFSSRPMAYSRVQGIREFNKHTSVIGSPTNPRWNSALWDGQAV